MSEYSQEIQEKAREFDKRQRKKKYDDYAQSPHPLVKEFLDDMKYFRRNLKEARLAYMKFSPEAVPFMEKKWHQLDRSFKKLTKSINEQRASYPSQDVH